MPSHSFSSNKGAYFCLFPLLGTLAESGGPQKSTSPKKSIQLCPNAKDNISIIWTTASYSPIFLWSCRNQVLSAATFTDAKLPGRADAATEVFQFVSSPNGASETSSWGEDSDSFKYIPHPPDSMNTNCKKKRAHLRYLKISSLYIWRLQSPPLPTNPAGRSLGNNRKTTPKSGWKPSFCPFLQSSVCCSATVTVAGRSRG